MRGPHHMSARTEDNDPEKYEQAYRSSRKYLLKYALVSLITFCIVCVCTRYSIDGSIQAMLVCPWLLMSFNVLPHFQTMSRCKLMLMNIFSNYGNMTYEEALINTHLYGSKISFSKHRYKFLQTNFWQPLSSMK